MALHFSNGGREFQNFENSGNSASAFRQLERKRPVVFVQKCIQIIAFFKFFSFDGTTFTSSYTARI